MRCFHKIAAVLALCAGISAVAASLPTDWKRQQTFDLLTNGLVKISLPTETLDSSRAGLEDLRLFDDAGKEIPYIIERPRPVARIVQNAKAFHVSLNPDNTIVTLETGLSAPLEGVALDTPETAFLKSVTMESSVDGRAWRTIARGEPIFRQPNGARRLELAMPPTMAKWLRLTVDDRRSQPIPFTGARVRVAAGEPTPSETLPAVITERDENPGETRLEVNLGAANLDLVAMQLETAEPLFMRQVTLAVPQVREDSIREQIIGQGGIFRVGGEGQSPAENLSVPLERQARSRVLILTIANGDSPPLPITAVRMVRRPTYLIFSARGSGAFHLLSGNDHCAPPRYDLAALNMNLNALSVATVRIPPPSENPDYRAPEILPGLELAGAALNVTDWSFRKKIQIPKDGAQQAELDLDVLARAQPSFSDLRLLRGSNQVPYILQRTSISRTLAPVVSFANDPKDLKLSRWTIKLPHHRLPLTRLTCRSPSPLFSRSISLYETLTDERGDSYRHELGHASWTQTPERKSKEFAVLFEGAPPNDTIFLETENGDNPPIELTNFQATYLATRILFKAKNGDELDLYYGQPSVGPPSYDLSLVADELMAADKRTNVLTEEERVKETSWRENAAQGRAGIVFWGILAVVVVTLLLVISRLLPKPEALTK